MTTTKTSTSTLPPARVTMRVSAVLLGLFDGYMSRSADARPSETKLGGCAVVSPALSATQAADVDAWTRCGVCGRRMFLLTQAYCPLTSLSTTSAANDSDVSSARTDDAAPPRASQPGHHHHRMLYVYCCNAAACAQQPSSSWAAFSVQYDTHNDNNDDNGGDDNDDDDYVDAPLARAQLPSSCFPPCWVHVDDEPTAADSNNNNNNSEDEDEARQLALMAEMNARARARCGIDVSDLADLEAAVAACSNNNNDDDDDAAQAQRSFDKFHARVERAPTQVLRYYARTHRHDDDKNDKEAAAAQRKLLRPLFMHPARVARQHRIPACTRCGAALLHEMQVMPAALYYLRVGDYTSCHDNNDDSNNNNNNSSSQDALASSDDGVDFATATVYTCSRDCVATLRGVHVQREVLCVEAAPPLRMHSA